MKHVTLSLGLLVFALLLTGCSSEPEAVLNDKPVSHWANQLSDHDVQKRISAVKILIQGGPESAGAIDELEEALSDEDIRAFVGKALQAIGPPAVDALGRAFVDKDRDIRKAATGALAAIGKPSIGVLREALSHENKLVRQKACKVLGDIGPDAKDAIPEIEKLLGDIDDITQAQAKDAINKIQGGGS